MQKSGTTKGKAERSKIDQQTLEDILRSPEDSSDEDIQKERTKETFTADYKNRLQISKTAAGQSTYTFSQTLQNYELSDSSDSDEKEVEAVAKGTFNNELSKKLENVKQNESNSKYDYFEKNIHDPEARAALISALSASDDDSDENSSSDEFSKPQIKNTIGKSQPHQFDGKELSRQMVFNKLEFKFAFQRVTDVLNSIEQNEKQNDTISDKLAEQAGQLLSFKKEYYDMKKELLLYSQYTQIQEKLFEQTDHKYFGVVSCINLFRNFVFIGNSIGYIRVFDVKTSKEMKPLYDEQVQMNKVTCIDITEDGHYLLAGYKKGTLVLWDANKYKLARLMNDVAKNEITAAKILYVTDQGTINMVFSEDVGRIRFVEVYKGNFFGGYNHNAYSLYEERLVGAATISVCVPSSLPGYESKFCSQACLVAFGASNQVVLCSMRPIKELISIKPSRFNRKRSIPYIDWGYGLTPTIREKTLPLMAVAWDRLIQLVYINDQTNEIEMDGYYCCDEEINQIYFMADSILVVLVNNKEIKVLYTTKFQPGDYKHLDVESNKDDLIQSVFKNTIQVTKHSELESGFELNDIRRGVIAINNNKQQFSNFNNTVTKYQKSIIFVSGRFLTRARLLSWREYIEKLKFSDNYDWLTVLKAALEIYNGELKGFALLPDEKERRETYLKDYMKKLIMTSIQTVLYKYQKHVDNKSESNSAQEEVKTYSIEEIAIKVSIEFCLNINETGYLFNEIYEFFMENGLKENFIKQLCPPIVAGQFRKEYIPEAILEKLIIYLEAKGDYKVLEKIIQQLDLSKYPDTSNNAGSQTTNKTPKGIVPGLQSHKISMKAYLEVLCSTNCMVSALLFLYTSEVKEDGGCKQILEMMHKNMEEKKSQEELERKRNTNTRQLTKEDIRTMQSVDRERRYYVEKSYLYTGYKLLWIIKMFLDGKKFPYGNLSHSQWQQHTFQIISFIMNDKYLNDVFIFDPEQFFKVIARLFCGQPWKFFSQWRQNDPVGSLEPWDFFMKLETEALRASRLENSSKILQAFYEFVLNVLVTQYFEKNEIAEKQDDLNTHAQLYKLASEYRFLDIEQNVIVQAVLNAFEAKESTTDLDSCTDPKLIQQALTGAECPVDENLIIETLNARKFDTNDIDAILAKMIKQKHPMTNIKIKLYEKKKDYVEAFELHFSNPQLKKKVFQWLEVTLQVLHDEELTFQGEQVKETEIIQDIDIDGKKKQKPVLPQFEPLQKLKGCMRKRMVELAQMSCKKTRLLITKWFDEGQYQQQLIMQELGRFPDIQFEYLLSYVTDNENEFAETIKESVYQPERQKQAMLYTTFLVRFTRLLCEFQKNQVEQWVKRDYFPVTECLEVCRAMKHERGEAVLVKREGQYMNAIKLYLGIIEKIDLATVIDNFIRVEPNKDTYSSEAWEVGTVSAFETGMGLFDEILEKACKIAEKKENNCNVTGDDGWFAILEFLQNFSVMSSIKVNEVLQKNEKRKSSFDRAASISKETHIERLKDFVNRRINYILRKPTLEISLKTIMDRLELKFLQVQKLYNHKIAKMNEEMRLEVYSERVLSHDVNQLFFENRMLIGQGSVCNPQDQEYVVRQGKKFPVGYRADSSQICQHCKRAWIGQNHVASQNVIVFSSCGHQYHQNCLNLLEDSGKCARCEKFILADVEKKDLSKTEKEKITKIQGLFGKKKSKEIQPTGENPPAAADPEESSKKRSLNLVMRVLENFDQQLEQQMLTAADFAK